MALLFRGPVAPWPGDSFGADYGRSRRPDQTAGNAPLPSLPRASRRVSVCGKRTFGGAALGSVVNPERRLRSRAEVADSFFAVSAITRISSRSPPVRSE